MIDIQRKLSAVDLSKEWDAHAVSIFQRRDFLGYAEKFNPCRQRYYELTEDGALSAGAIVYTLRLDLLTFLGAKSPVRMNIIGVPVGVAMPGFLGSSAHRDRLLSRIAQQERGMLVTLNVDAGLDLPIGRSCRMVPTVMFENTFETWPDYLGRLRSSHRRRIRKIEQAASALNRKVGRCSEFSGRHYALYRQVHDRAPAKLETLTLEFFRNLPDEFSLSSYDAAGDLVSWTITVPDGSRLVYFFGGMDYRVLHQYQSYLVGLMNIVRDGIAGRFASIDLGQTAENPKLRFGGRTVPLDMFLSHHNPLLRRALAAAAPLLGYRPRLPHFHVFSDREGQA